MVFPMVCASCGRDLTEARYRLHVQQLKLAEVLRGLRNFCCRLKLATQIEPYRNLTVQPLLDIN
ncbi:DNA-dependent RNA polymerase 7 kDa subunit [Equine molluscum contagiosum-like virus]|nr:DNA-dependent RNA polymerase 7 kDa subunit [Equine molluscum contagiosum-like virus]